jgi:6-phosphogluconolactonase
MTDRGTALYRSVGERLTHFEVDVARATLTERASLALPAKVQYVWPHHTRRHLYVAASDGGPGARGARHFVSALNVAPDGSLAHYGEPQTLRARPLHLSLSRDSSHAFLAYNDPSGLTVHRIEADGRLSAEISQPVDLDFGVYAHQVLVTPSNRTVVLVTRGNDAEAERAEDPGALKLYRFNEGVLQIAGSIAPAGGFGFGPRHMDFHPTKPWVYVSLERQNRLQMFRMTPDGLDAAAAYTADTLQAPRQPGVRQLSSAIHVHPGGRYVYVANRADSTVESAGGRVFAGGENTLAAFSIEPDTGEPKLMQHIDCRGFHVRTFSLDPSGRLLVAASIKGLSVQNDGKAVPVAAGLSVFRVGADGKLRFERKYDVDTGDKLQFWSGMMALP